MAGSWGGENLSSYIEIRMRSLETMDEGERGADTGGSAVNAANN
jgi:hypothetical protein